MEIFLGQTIGFWIGFIGGIFILLHIPSCNKHWASRLRPFSDFLSKYHNVTLNLAAIFALIHLVMDLVGFVFNIWI